jgi:hypothetical protein
LIDGVDSDCIARVCAKEARNIAVAFLKDYVQEGWRDKFKAIDGKFIFDPNVYFDEFIKEKYGN